MTTGIYCLKFIGTDKVYVGQSTNIELRYKQHLHSLKIGKANSKLIDAYKLYGQPTISILEICSLDSLNTLESHYITKLDSFTNGFNLTEASPSGLYGDKHPSSKYPNSKLLEVLNYLILNKYTHKEISVLTDVTVSIVENISNGSSHMWLSEQYPEKYAILNQQKYSKNGSASQRGIIYPAIKSPEGKVYYIQNVCKFAKEHSLDNGHLGKVLRGIRKTHKGWRL